MTTSAVSLLAGVLVLAACAGGPRSRSAPVEPPMPMAVRVTNHHPAMVSVTAVTRRSAQLLGFVETHSGAVFVFPCVDERATAVEIAIHSLETGEMYSSGTIVGFCPMIDLTVESDLPRSWLWLPVP
jgi:uncharacterized lipoprotein YajG